MVWAVAASVVVVLVISAVAVVLLTRSDGKGGELAVTAPTVAALPPVSAGPASPATPPSPTRQSKAVEPGTSSTPGSTASPGGAAGGGAGASPALTPTPTPTPTPTATSADGPVIAGVAHQEIACGGGYIVQVASEADPAGFERRILTARAAGQLPAQVKWANTQSSCAIFTAQSNLLVLYAGPFSSPLDACPARLTSPPDAFIKGTTTETATEYHSCLCPAAASSLPVIGAVGQQDVWVGELQRVLGARLDYRIGSINADPAVGDPGRWGSYTAETAAAVGRFQGDNGLPVSRQVDAATWAALQARSC